MTDVTAAMERVDRVGRNSISVAIPTFKRPAMLRDTLESVRNQSRRDLIAEVIVSENSQDTRSEQVVGEFTDLPIRFIRQSPPLQVGDHLSLLPSLCQAQFVALVGDDDMWGRYHLEESARLLNSESDAVACVNVAVIVNDSSRSIDKPHSTLIQAASPPISERFADHLLFGPKDVLVSSLLWTPLNMWAIVAQREPLMEAFRVFLDPDQGTDCDRYMLWRLSTIGPIAIGREVGLFYRMHRDSGCAQMDAAAPDFHRQSWKRNVQRMLDESADLGIDARKEWLNAVGVQSLSWVNSISSPLTCASREVLVDRWGSNCGLADAPPQMSGAGHFLRQCLPPIVVRAARRLSHVLSRG